MPTIKQQLRQEILKRRGLAKGRAGHLVQSQPAQLRTDLTTAMQLLELQHGKPIEVLLAPHLSVRLVGRRLGINYSTVSKWRNQLGL